MTNPVRSVECAIAPVVLNVFTIEPYATPEVVAYRQVAFSSVIRPNVTWVVAAGSTPLGCPPLRTGVRDTLPPGKVRMLLNVTAAMPACPPPYTLLWPIQASTHPPLKTP